MPPVLPRERWALTPPFHPYLLRGGFFSVERVKDHSSQALPGTLLCGAPTFLKAEALRLPEILSGPPGRSRTFTFRLSGECPNH